MSDETRLAFAHPSERAEATAGPEPLDRISVRDFTVEVEIGAFQAERDTTQRVRFNVVVEVQPIEAPVEDDVDRILSYDKVTEAIHAELAAERLNLLETLAERIGDRILAEPQAVRVFVRIEKMDRGPGVLGVEIVRGAEAKPKHSSGEEAPHPTIVFLSNAAMVSDHLEAWVSELCDRDRAVIFCVGPHDKPGPQLADSVDQQRIDLLAIEQNAWVLASKVAQCAVVATRTELDWAMKNGQPCVWAPSKIVLDSVVVAPNVSEHGGLALAIWFADEMQAHELLSIGETLPETGTIPARFISIDTDRL